MTTGIPPGAPAAPEDHVCSDCDEGGATVRMDDAADEEHWFHPACRDELLSFLSAPAPPPRGGAA